MYRFFINDDAIEGEMVEISGSDFNHISHSLRLKPGDEIVVSTGDGRDLLVEIAEFSEKWVKSKIVKSYKNQNEPSLKITLAQGIPKKDNMDLIVQKCTEIGVNQIIPLETERTIVKLKGKKREKRRQRWQRISEEAAKQSQRGIIPAVEPVHNLKDIAKISDEYDLILVPWEDEKTTTLEKAWIKEAESVLIIIGPEGGFPEREIEFLKKLNAVPVTLGPRILRTETAGLVALTMALHLAGDLGG